MRQSRNDSEALATQYIWALKRVHPSQVKSSTIHSGQPPAGAS